MPRKAAQKQPNSGIEPVWWYVNTKFKFDPSTKMIYKKGEDIRKFRLDDPNTYDRLLKDLAKNVMVVDDAIDWVEDSGFLTMTAMRAHQESAFAILQKASDVRWLLSLDDALRRGESGDHAALIELANSGGTYTKDGITRRTISFPPAQLHYPPKHKLVWPEPESKPDDLTAISKKTTPTCEFCASVLVCPSCSENEPKTYNGFLGQYQLFSERLDLNLLEIFLAVTKEEWSRHHEWCLRHAARNCLRIAIDRMIDGVNICLNWKSDDKGDWVLTPAYQVQTPWQAIGLAAMSRVCGQSVRTELCKSPDCRKLFIPSRTDQEFCPGQRCQKWHYRNVLNKE